MKLTLPLAASLSLTSLALPQTALTTRTSTDFGVVAERNEVENIDGVDINTVLTLPKALSISNGPVWARTRITSAHEGDWKGIQIEESGLAVNTSSEGEVLAATIDEAVDHHAPHGLLLVVENAPSLQGTVKIIWRGDVSDDDSFARCEIDLNGDLIPDFTGTATGHTVTKEFPVTGTAAGFFFAIKTECAAELEGRGATGYSARLTVLFQPSTACTFTPFGPECSGKLTGSVSSGRGSHDLTLDLAGAQKSAFGATVLGFDRAQISLGGCDLLVAPRVYVPFRTDANGAATHRFSVPSGHGFVVLVQDVTLTTRFGTSNGLKIECR